MNLALPLILLVLVSCSTTVKTSELKKKNLIGHWRSSVGTRFNYMDITCKGDFQFITFNQEDKGVHISEMTDSRINVSPEYVGHYYEIHQWPTKENKYVIAIKYVNDSYLQSLSSSLSKMQTEKSKPIYRFQRAKTYKCN